MGWLNFCLAGWKHRQKEQRGRGIQDEKIGERRQDIGERVGGEDLARAGAPGSPATGLALSKPLALGLQFVFSIGRKMKEMPE